MTSTEIISQCRLHHGGKKYNKYNIRFHFREFEYDISFKKGSFSYTRSYEDKNKIRHRQVLTNHGYTQYENNQLTIPDEKSKFGRVEAINSVVYFAMLPQSLNDAAVISQLVGETQILNDLYYVIRVSFRKDGGGVDHQDIFYYWINKTNFRMDYLAYDYDVNGGGVRFRAAYNPRRVGDILFQDYINYKASKDIDMLSLPRLYELNQLTELSRIMLKNISVR